jgi:hypothetical protein
LVPPHRTRLQFACRWESQTISSGDEQNARCPRAQNDNGREPRATNWQAGQSRCGATWTSAAARAMFVDMAERELIAALDLLAAGDWRTAHEIVQKHDSTLGAWLHGIVHTLEGDDDNARYWYQQAGRTFRGRAAVEEELAAARQAAAG